MLQNCRRFFCTNSNFIVKNRKNERIINRFFDKIYKNKNIKKQSVENEEVIEVKNIKENVKNKEPHWGLNSRPPHYKCDALPLSIVAP